MSLLVIIHKPYILL